MLVTLTRYTVASDSRPQFDEEQRLFHRLDHQPGFVFRGGGWSAEERATVLGFWKDQASHDAAEKSAQHSMAVLRKGRAHAKVVTLPWTAEAEVKGQAPLLSLALARARHLRCDLFRVKEDRIGAFLEKRSEVWAPALVAAGGMLGAVFTRGEGDWFMTVSAWRDSGSHRVFADARVPELIQAARAKRHCLEGREYDMALIPEWSVRG